MLSREAGRSRGVQRPKIVTENMVLSKKVEWSWPHHLSWLLDRLKQDLVLSSYGQ